MRIVRYQFNGETAIYVDNRLAVSAHHEDEILDQLVMALGIKELPAGGDNMEIIEHLAQTLNFEERTDGYYRGGAYEPLRTLTEVEEYTKDKLLRWAKELHQQAEKLEQQAAALG